jgi:hypothetical protein
MKGTLLSSPGKLLIKFQNILRNTTQVIIWHRVINSCAKSAWYARRQHSYNICKDFLSHNFWMKNLNFTKKYTDRKTINSNNYAKFEVNWPRGSQFTAWHVKRTDRWTDSRTLVYHNTSRLKDGRIKILFSIISSPITLERQRWKSSKMKGILLSSSVSGW